MRQQFLVVIDANSKVYCKELKQLIEVGIHDTINSIPTDDQSDESDWGYREYYKSIKIKVVRLK